LRKPQDFLFRFNVHLIIICSSALTVSAEYAQQHAHHNLLSAIDAQTKAHWISVCDCMQRAHAMTATDLNRIVWQIALSAAAAAMSVFTFKLVKMRTIFYKLKKQGLVRNPVEHCRLFQADAIQLEAHTAVGLRSR
jgi:hypothetical protein